MAGNSQDTCIDRWMEAALHDGDWVGPVEASVSYLGAKAVALSWRDACDIHHLQVSQGAPGAFAAQCRALAHSEAANGRHREGIVHERRFPELGDIAWITRGSDPFERVVSVSLFCLLDDALDAPALRNVASAARSSIIMRERLSATRASSGLKTAGFDQMPFGVAVVDECLRVAEINEAMRAILARADGLCAPQGRLICRETADQAALSRLALTAIRGGLSAPVVRVARGSSVPPYVVRAISRRDFAETKATHCLLMIVDPDAQPPRATDIWRTLFDLTECELAVAQAIVCGLRISSVAEQRGVSVETVRTQTKRMFERLNVSSQAEAAARLMRTAPFTALPDAGEPALVFAAP